MAKVKDTLRYPAGRYPYQKEQKIKPVDTKGAGGKPLDPGLNGFTDPMPEVMNHEPAKTSCGKPRPETSQVTSCRPEKKNNKK